MISGFACWLHKALVDLTSRICPKTCPPPAQAPVHHIPLKMSNFSFSRNADEVFYYDLHTGARNGNDKGLLMHLEILRQEASKDGDVIFSLPDGDRIWAHSILFYVAAGGRLPSSFGTPRRLDTSSDAVETVSNSLGVVVTVLHITEDRQLAFEQVMNSCYTIDSLSGVWDAMGYSAVVFSGKDFERNAPLPPTLPTSMLPDFEIHLKEAKGKSTLFSVKVHKFLLARRIPYYETFLGSGFRDASGMTSTVYTEEFTAFSLWAVANFVYHKDPSSVFEGHPDLKYYITPSPIAPNSSPCCASFETNRPIPALGIADKLLEIAKSAHYLQANNLENWANFFLCELGHHFQCQGRGCIEFIPHILNLVVDNDITDRWIFKKGISLLAQHKSISTMWKRSLLKCKPPVLESLIGEIKNSSEREGESERIVQLFVRLLNLRRHTSTSKNSSDWDRKLIVPLMDHTTETIAAKFDSPEVTSALATMFRGMNFSRPIGEELLERIMDNKILREESCRQIFIGIIALMKSCGYNAPEVEQAKAKCITWFERKWVTLSLTPAPRTKKACLMKRQNSGSVDSRENDDQENSAETLRPSPNQRNTPRTLPKNKSKDRIKKAPAATDVDEGNFFSAWEQSELEDLAKELPASMSDLLATSHRRKPPVDDKYKPVKTMRVGRFSAGGAGESSRGGVSASISDIWSVSDTGADRGSNASGRNAR